MLSLGKQINLKFCYHWWCLFVVNCSSESSKNAMGCDNWILSCIHSSHSDIVQYTFFKKHFSTKEMLPTTVQFAESNNGLIEKSFKIQFTMHSYYINTTKKKTFHLFVTEVIRRNNTYSHKHFYTMSIQLSHTCAPSFLFKRILFKRSTINYIDFITAVLPTWCQGYQN